MYVRTLGVCMYVSMLYVSMLVITLVGMCVRMSVLKSKYMYVRTIRVSPLTRPPAKNFGEERGGECVQLR